MTRKIIATILLSAATAAGYAQGAYFRAGFGYAFAQAGQTIDGSGTPYNGTFNNNTQAYSLKGCSFGAGGQAYLGFGYMFSRNVGVQLDANLGFSSKQYTFEADNVDIGGGVTGTFSVSQHAQSPTILMPSLVLQSGGDPWNIYARFGLALPLNTKIIQDQVSVNGPNTGMTVADDFTITVKNSFSLGFTGAAGVQYRLNDKVSLWGELSVRSLSVYIKESKLTDASENGQSVPLSQVSGNQLITYSKNVTADSTGTHLPAYSQPFSNVGINLGVTFILSRGRSTHSSVHKDEDYIDHSKPYRRR